MRLHYIIGFSAAFVLAAALGIYMLLEPARQAQAQQDLLARQVDEGQVLYAEECAVCHGAAGEGLGANPPLDSAGLRSMDYDTLYKTIARGRYNTAMPAWSVTDGGPLNDAQIEALLALIQHGDWLETRGLVADLGLAPRAPISVTVPAETLALIAALPDGAALARAVQTYAAECVACHTPVDAAEGAPGPSLAPALNTEQLRTERTAEQLTNAIQFGVAGTVMPAWGQTLTAGQIADLVALIQRWDELPPAAIPEPPAQPIIVTEKLLAAGAPRAGPERADFLPDLHRRRRHPPGGGPGRAGHRHAGLGRPSIRARDRRNCGFHPQLGADCAGGGATVDDRGRRAAGLGLAAQPHRPQPPARHAGRGRARGRTDDQRPPGRGLAGSGLGRPAGGAG